MAQPPISTNPRRRLLSLGLLGVFTDVLARPTIEERRKKIKARHESVSQEAIQRRARSEAALKSEGVPVNKHLPVIEPESEAKRRSKDEVAQRALCVLLVAVKGEGLDQVTVDRIVAEYGLRSWLTPNERSFVAAKTPSQHERVQSSWKYEAAWVLLWALGYVDSLEKPTTTCDVRRAVRTMKERSAKKFIEDAKLRPLSEILDQADLIYRYHWATVEAWVKKNDPPAGLKQGVVVERHYALNWLIGYMGQDWDDISTDT